MFIVLARKELRALGPVAALTLIATLGANNWLHTYSIALNVIRSMGVVAFSIGTIALGALSFGYEYEHRSIGAMLSLPVRRATLIAAKLSVLVPLLLMLCAAGRLVRIPVLLPWSTLDIYPESLRPYVPLFLCALGIAPFFAIRFRSAVAGALMAIAVPVALRLGGELAGQMHFGFDGLHSPAATRVGLWALQWGTIVACLAGIALTWYSVWRLEWSSFDGSTSSSRVAPYRANRTRTFPAIGYPRTPLRALAHKEFRLQLATLTVAATYASVRLLFFLVRRRHPDFGVGVELFDGLNVILVSFLSGAFAFATERNVGTTTSESVLPVPTRVRWMLKVGVAAFVALAFGAGLPALLHAVRPSVDDFLSVESSAELGSTSLMLLCVMLPLAISLHMGSFCTSVLRAVVRSAVAALAALLITNLLMVELARTTRYVIGWFVSGHLAGGTNEAYDRAGAWQNAHGWQIVQMGWVAVSLCAVLPILYSFRNFRTSETPRVARQLWTVAGTLVGGMTLFWAAASLWITALALDWIN